MNETMRPYFFNLTESNRPEEPICLDSDIYVNKYISRYLKPYQIEGIKFMYKAYSNNRGCILADDMGLGKTVQVIGLLAALLNKTGLEKDLNSTKLDCIKKQMNLKLETNKEQLHFLIVCPATIVENWLKELNRWGYFSICKFHGIEREETLKRFENNRCEIMLTTHETCSRYINALKSLNFAAVIVDEFHKMKNDKSDLAKNLREFETLVRIGLSGTILQNDPIELWSLIDWVCPNSMGSKVEFNTVINKPIKEGHRLNASNSDLSKYTKAIDLIQNHNKNIILRRTKQLIADQLPKKTDQVVYCKLTDFQMKIYQKFIDSAEFQYLNTKCDECPCKKFNLKKRDCCFEELKLKEKSMQLAFIDIFLKIGNHPALLLSQTASICNEYIERNLPELLDEKIKTEFDELKNCGKMKVLVQMLEAMYIKKAKVLLFSYSVRLLNIIQTIASDKRYNFVRLDGNTKNKDRLKIVDQFNQNENIFLFLISTKAGGVGLNITGANIVIIFDPNWNPTHEMQCADRAYRFGQMRDVHVYRLISAGCLEENIYLRQIYKMHLNKECVEKESTKRLFQISKDLKNGELFGLKNLFSLNTNRNECLTIDLLKRYTNIEKGIAGIEVSAYVVSNEDHLIENEDSNSSDDDESLNEDEDEEDNDSFESKMNKILKKQDVVHVHSNKDLIKTSKIENHLRSVASKSNVNSNQYAFDCNIRPDLSTLDCIELEEETYEDIDTNQHRFVLDNGDIIQYGQVPDEIKRVQFEKMAKLLKISTQELAQMVLKMPKEMRFKKLKRFYTQTVPESKEFYKMFSKNKSKTINRKENQEYEYIETLNGVMDLIDEDVTKEESKIESDEIKLDTNDILNDDVMFENFMNHKEALYEEYSPFKKRKSDNN